jgi:mannose-6-phosphate isomerase-like protein (cupin superfamily)
MKYSRRDLALLIPALAAAQQPPKGLPSRVFKYDDLPVRINGENKSRAVMKGETHSGFPIELHMTELGPSQAPHGPHKHVHEELLMLKDGSLDVTISGQTAHVTAGSIVYVASNEMHGWRNPGAVPAQYFVLALGNDAPS